MRNSSKESDIFQSFSNILIFFNQEAKSKEERGLWHNALLNTPLQPNNAKIQPIPTLCAFSHIKPA